jgi:hypothetical protein
MLSDEQKIITDGSQVLYAVEGEHQAERDQ